MKCVLDFVAAMCGLIVLSPLLALLFLLVRIKMGTPVLFRQQRPGLNAKPFYMYKFRTMIDAKDSNGNLLSDEERLTGFGHFLRSTSLDELPELFNVLKCEMSLVGPRPLLMEYIPLYSAEESRRHQVRPGITGWAQVNGRNAITWSEKLKLDLWYVDNHNLWIDFKILVTTLLKVLTREGIQQDGHATVGKFTGSKI